MSAKNGKPCKKCGAAEWGSQGRCKQCARDSSARWRKSNPDRHRETSRRWARENPKTKKENDRRWRETNPEHTKEYRRKWYEVNSEAVNEKARDWARANPDRHRENSRRWSQNNPEAVRAKKHRRKAKVKGTGGSFTSSEWKTIVEYYGNKCLRCGRDDVKLTPDHVIPLSKGGTSNIDNIQPLCLSCNSSKGTKIIDYRPGAGLGRWIQKKLFG